jgi:hypothetical protein
MPGPQNVTVAQRVLFPESLINRKSLSATNPRIYSRMIPSISSFSGRNITSCPDTLKQARKNLGCTDGIMNDLGSNGARFLNSCPASHFSDTPYRQNCWERERSRNLFYLWVFFYTISATVSEILPFLTSRKPKVSPSRSSKRRRSDSNRCIKVLQTSPLPLGYGAIKRGRYYNQTGG